MKTLPEKDWFTIADMAAILETTEDYVEHCLISGKLNASINLPLMSLIKCKEECDGLDIYHEGFGAIAVCGIYNIKDYTSIKWNKSEDGTKSADLFNEYVYLSNNGCIGFYECDGKAECEYSYRFKKSYIIEKNDIAITPQEVNRFKTEYCGTTSKAKSLSKKAVDPVIEDPRIIDGLLKMVIAMAKDCYGYDPANGKNTATADIRKALEICGLHLSDNTIRSRLKEGAELLPRDESLEKSSKFK
ncbi:MAG: hypothetical protein M0T70_09170 [Geobacteraceae bacterium]|nr:hypothetical protein [Geobacteraceae bacterium]